MKVLCFLCFINIYLQIVEFSVSESRFEKKKTSQLTFYLDTSRFQKKNMPESKCFPNKKLLQIKMPEKRHTCLSVASFGYSGQCFSSLVWALSFKMTVVSYLLCVSDERCASQFKTDFFPSTRCLPQRKAFCQIKSCEIRYNDLVYLIKLKKRGWILTFSMLGDFLDYRLTSYFENQHLKSEKIPVFILLTEKP